jgi:catechol 2,3-dioxygenase-like lactoylglutathione lyase family enzyme
LLPGRERLRARLQAEKVIPPEGIRKMKRLHVHVAVEDLNESIRFYSALFATRPSVTKPDYAKWMLDDPCMNFAISVRGRTPGLDHLGIQVENKSELDDVYARLKAANRPVTDQGNATCCYAKSEKSWIVDPSGISWETFLTHGESTVYGDGTGERANSPRMASTEACGCAPKTEVSRCC